MGGLSGSQYPLAQRYGLGVSSCAPGITCAPGCSPLEWNQNIPSCGQFGWNQNIPSCGQLGWNQNLINQTPFTPFGSVSQTGVFGRQFGNQSLYQGLRPSYHHDILSGATDIPLKTSSGQLAYQQPTPQSEKMLHGLLVDRLENLKVTNWVEDALNLLKGERSVDKVCQLLCSGNSVDPRVLIQAIQADRSVDIGVAELIEKMMHFRRRNCEAVHLTEHLMSGKVYDGPIFNSVTHQAKMAAMDVVKRKLIDLYAISGRI